MRMMLAFTDGLTAKGSWLVLRVPNAQSACVKQAV